MRGRRLASAALGATAGIALIALALDLAGAPRRGAPGAVGRGGEPAYYVDCSGRRGGDGSRQRPWSDLRRVSRVTLAPGSSLLLARGSVCHGSLAPRGSGRPGAPIVIGAYGRGRAPRIEADGASPDAVRLADESYVVLQDLELTNHGDYRAPHGDYRAPRRGAHVVADRPGTVRDVVLRRLYVHDVLGSDRKDLGGSGGIQVDDPTASVTIADNRVQDVNRSGIWVAGTGIDPRPPSGDPWPSASTGVTIAHNTVLRVGGDGIVPTGTVGAVVSDNVVCCGNLRGRRPAQFDAGIWTFNSDGTVIERNLVYGMRNGQADGEGYDVDYDQDGTIVQSNYGYDNAGGFILLCEASEHRTADVRFNLSVGEYVFDESACDPAQSRPGTLDGVRVYNNTFLTPTSLIRDDSITSVRALPRPGGFQFADNIVVATKAQSVPLPCGRHCVANLFWGLPRSGARALEADPLFVSGAARAEDRLQAAASFELAPGSSAVGAGVTVAGSGGADYFGDPIGTPPAIGFYQPPGLPPLLRPGTR